MCLAVGQALKANQTAEMAAALEKFLCQYGTNPAARALVSKLQAVLAGSRDPELANDPELPYDGAAEVRLLLEEMK